MALKLKSVNWRKKMLHTYNQQTKSNRIPFMFYVQKHIDLI